MNENYDLNVFKYGYYYWGYWKNWFKNINQFFVNIKYAWQRATKGYCDQDIWNLSWFYDRHLIETLKVLANTTDGFPVTVGGVDGYKSWQNYLRTIAELLEKSQDDILTDSKYYPNKYFTEYKKLFNRPLFTKRLEDGCYLFVDNDTPAEVKLRKQYWKEYKQIRKLKLKDRKKAFDMLYNCWDSLLD